MHVIGNIEQSERFLRDRRTVMKQQLVATFQVSLHLEGTCLQRPRRGAPTSCLGSKGKRKILFTRVDRPKN